MFEELLLNSRQESARTLPKDGDEFTRGSLIRQVRSLVGISGAYKAGEEELPGGEWERVCCRDGYVRRSPVQAYRTPEDYPRRRIRKALVILIVLIIAALLALAIFKSGIIRF